MKASSLLAAMDHLHQQLSNVHLINVTTMSSEVTLVQMVGNIEKIVDSKVSNV